jgi:hypothetical protein
MRTSGTDEEKIRRSKDGSEMWHIKATVTTVRDCELVYDMKTVNR